MTTTTTAHATINVQPLPLEHSGMFHTVRYVPPLRARSQTTAASAFCAVHRDVTPPYAMTATHSNGSLIRQECSAFKVVLPRFYNNWMDTDQLRLRQQLVVDANLPEAHRSSTSSTNQTTQLSYSKIIARNELLKLLVTKQLKTDMRHRPHHYPTHEWHQHQHQNAAIDLSHKTAQQQLKSQQPDSTSHGNSSANAHAGRLLQLSSVIKTINATKTDNRSEKINQSITSSIVPTTVPTSQNRSSPIVECKSPLIFRCEWSDCNRTFVTAEQWTIHVTHTHVIADASDGLYYCQWRGCPRAPNGFNARYKMLIHVRSHTNDKPYRCPQCAKSFLRSETLRIHKRIHSSDKLFACKFLGCTKRYTDPSSLRKHVKTKNHIVVVV